MVEKLECHTFVFCCHHQHWGIYSLKGRPKGKLKFSDKLFAQFNLSEHNDTG